MARNQVQFQKGFSMTAFIQQYGSEAKCFEALFKWRWPNGFICPHCGCDKHCQLTERKLQQCYRCHLPAAGRSTNLSDSRHTVRIDQAAADSLVSGSVPDDAAQKRRLGHGATPSVGHFLQCRLAHEAQAHAGDDGA